MAARPADRVKMAPCSKARDQDLSRVSPHSPVSTPKRVSREESRDSAVQTDAYPRYVLQGAAGNYEPTEHNCSFDVEKGRGFRFN